MVQALAFAEIFLGLILADAGYKGVSVSRVVKGEAGAGVPPVGLGGASGATPGETGSSGEATLPSGGALAPPPGSTFPGSSEASNLALFPALAGAKGILEAKLHRKVPLSEVGNLYEKYHPEKNATKTNHPPTAFESLTGQSELR